MKFQINRPDINKIVLKSIEADDVEHALGKYMSTLMLVGIIPMNRKGEAAELVAENTFKLSNDWIVEVSEI